MWNPNRKAGRPRKALQELSTNAANNAQRRKKSPPQKGLLWINSIKENYGLNADEVLKKTWQTIPEKLPEALQSTVDKAYEINFAELPKQVKTWITEHPYQTTFQIANGIVFFYPVLLLNQFSGLLNRIQVWRKGRLLNMQNPV
ncbi:hypothetical protein GJ744_005064 [Endocarpon pusillum]|uniref:Uncharacterized protein n=1 Tax=Endocarpon pusillum TaxID=364733 RepID=A0A8H7E6J5_9EURO|nr:hypothetical protein GJ744_005064 [Endocarpon pusillum]